LIDLGEEIYQSSSPDEEALIQAAKVYGVRLKSVSDLRQESSRRH
jgi:magnesium-transporting ATPase (P-type)